METFTNIFRQLIDKSGKIQKDIALDLEISESKLSYYANGRGEPSYYLLIKIADYFNVSVDYLLGHEMHIHPEKIQVVENLEKENDRLQNELQIVKNKLNQIVDIATIE